MSGDRGRFRRAPAVEARSEAEAVNQAEAVNAVTAVKERRR
jgi:hypothetical protein